MSTISSSENGDLTKLNPRSKTHELTKKHIFPKPVQECSVEDDMNKYFEVMYQTISARSLEFPDQISKDRLKKKAMKRPMKSYSKIGFSDAMSLKQAFRGLSISQASETAAMKRLSKQANSSASIGSKNTWVLPKLDEKSQSRKSSIGECSRSRSTSGESPLVKSRPHMSIGMKLGFGTLYGIATSAFRECPKYC